MAHTALIVGASVAGVRTAQALRQEGWPGRIVLVDEEPELPYDKPPLSKQVLAGTWEPDRVRLLAPDEAAEAGVELLLGQRAVHLDPAARKVVLAGGRRLAYDTLVLATGASARPSPWRPESGVHVLRTLRDCLALRAVLAQPGDVVVVGAGFIGGEVASTARALGREVTIVDPLPVPMGRLLGPEIGQLFTDLHRRHGVGTRFGRGVERVTGVQGELEVELTDGSVLPAATVVVGIGARPNDQWVVDSGLLVEDGIVCDDTGRAQGANEVYAVGDVARWHHARHGAYVRNEHWTNAVEQAGCVAHTITHPQDPRAHAPVEYVWSDQHDWRAQIVGVPSLGTTHVVIGEPVAPARFAALFADGDRLVGALCVNWPKAMLLSRRLLAAGEHLSVAAERLQAVLPVRRPG